MTTPSASGLDTEFTRALGLYDSTMIVVGGMIGSGIFIVSADMARLVGSPGWLLVAWLVTGVLTMTAALSYGELAAMMPRAGGQYVYLREAFSPLWGFLYGWTLFTVIQTGTIAAVAVGFARFTGVLVPWIADDRYLIAPIHLSEGYALSLSTTQLVGIAMIVLLTWTNTRGVQWGKIIQNIFTTAKTAALAGLVLVGLLLGWNAQAVAANFGDFWTPRGYVAVAPGMTAATTYGLIVAIAVAQVGSLFSSDAWNNITFAAGEVKDPRRHIPLSLALGTSIVIGLYSNLLDYVVSAALMFYILTIAGIFRLRATRPDAERPYPAFGYPVVPALYILGASTLLLVLFTYRGATTWPGLVIVLIGVPVYLLWKKS